MRRSSRIQDTKAQPTNQATSPEDSRSNFRLRPTGGSRASRVAPTQRRGEALLLLGPCALYLIAFSIYPLVTSLVRSFQDYNSQKDTWRWIGLGNYRQLVSD